MARISASAVHFRVFMRALVMYTDSMMQVFVLFVDRKFFLLGFGPCVQDVGDCWRTW